MWDAVPVVCKPQGLPPRRNYIRNNKKSFLKTLEKPRAHARAKTHKYKCNTHQRQQRDDTTLSQVLQEYSHPASRQGRAAKRLTNQSSGWYRPSVGVPQRLREHDNGVILINSD
jgi:hypothetical protein